MNGRVVITGIGCCTPLGSTVGGVWAQLLAGRSGIGPITLFDASAFPVRIGGEVKSLDLPALTQQFPEAASEQDRKIWLGLAATMQAVADAGLERTDWSNAFLVVGVSLEVFFLERVVPMARPETSGQTFAQRALQSGAPLQTPLDRLTQLVGDHYRIGGGRSTNCSACAAGAQAVGEAFRRVRAGEVELALAGATDSALNPLGLGGFSLLHILSNENDQPQRACRPFDATRVGTVLAEGSTFLVLETRERAQARGARVYAEVIGYGSSLDAYRVTDPEPTGRGATWSMKRALADARLHADEVDCVNAHGTGTPKNDVAETLAIKRVLGPRADQIPVTANKSMSGHMIATSGAFEAAVAALTLSEGKLPPTINLQQRDPDCDLDYVSEGWRPFEGRTVLSNSFGFGGQNATLVFAKYEPPD